MFKQIHIIVAVCFIFLFSCSSEIKDQPIENRDKNEARNFRVQQLDSFVLISVLKTHKSATKPVHYLLHKKGDILPDISYTNAIEIPLNRVVVTNTVDMAFMIKLGLIDRIVAVSDTGYIYNTSIKDDVRKGEIKQIQRLQVMDYETLIDVSPDAIFMQQIDDGSTSEKLKELGIPIIYTADYLENSLLGRAKWITFIASFFQCKPKADSIYSEISQDYAAQLQTVKDQRGKRPKVLTGAVYEGVWFVAGGRSLMARCIQDAGGDYIWSDNDQTGGVPYSFEKVFTEASEADIWINVSNYRSKDRMLQENTKYELFKPFNQARMYNYYKRMTSRGGSDVFESAIVEPNLLLRDYIHMFNGQDSALHYYQLMES